MNAVSNIRCWDERKNKVYLMRWREIMNQFVLWGYGKRGKRFLDFWGNGNIMAIIDSDEKLQRQRVEGIPVISYNEYKEKYAGYDIVISMAESQEVEEQLEKDGIINYFLLSECPYEFMGFRGGKSFEELPITVDADVPYLIYGFNLYTIFLREFLVKNRGVKSCYIIPESLEKEKRFHEKYGHMLKNINLSELTGESILWGCNKPKEDLDVNLKVQDVFDFSCRISSYYSEKMRNYKDRFKGKKCFIVATGPSINNQDLSCLGRSDYVCFSVNRIYLSFENTEWRPDFLVITDGEMLTSYYEEIASADVRNIFVGDVVQGITERAKRDGLIVFHDHVEGNNSMMPKFSENPEWRTYSGATVVYACIQLAVYMGFREIYLLGTDHTYSDKQTDVSNHFHKDYYKGTIRPDKYLKNRVEAAYTAAKKYADEHGIKIYNATRGGKLEIFERIDFDSLFAKEG